MIISLGLGMLFWSKCAVVSIIVTLIAWYFGALHDLSQNDLRSAAGIVAQIGCTMLGFVLAAVAILTTVANTRLVRNMQRTGHFKVLITRMFGSVASFGVATLAGIMFLFLPQAKSVYAYPLIALIFFSSLLLLDVLQKFWTVLHHLQPDSNQAK